MLPLLRVPLLLRPRVQQQQLVGASVGMKGNECSCCSCQESTCCGLRLQQRARTCTMTTSSTSGNFCSYMRQSWWTDILLDVAVTDCLTSCVVELGDGVRLQQSSS